MHDPGRPTARELTRTRFRTFVRDRARAARLDRRYTLGVFSKRTRENIGTIDLIVVWRRPFHVINLGYEIHNQYWGSGYAKETAQAAVAFAFKCLKVHRVEAVILQGNKASIAVAKSIGMKIEGVRKRYYWHRGSWRDAVVFVAILEDRRSGTRQGALHHRSFQALPL